MLSLTVTCTSSCAVAPSLSVTVIRNKYVPAVVRLVTVRLVVFGLINV